MKGIILAAGSGSRLYPMTKVFSKHLIPVYDKPMIYYPISTLMLAGIREMLIISTPHDQALYERLLSDGRKWGIEIEYAMQSSPDGLAQAFIIAENYIKNQPSCLILGDNIFYGDELTSRLKKASKLIHGAKIFSYPVSDPERYGIVEFDIKGNVLSIEEKPIKPKSRYAITGLYFFDKNIVEISKSIKPSLRGELEITSVLNYYLKNKLLEVETFGRGIAWLDTGTQDSLLAASSFVGSIEKRQGFKISCPEEIAWRNRWINDDELKIVGDKLKNTDYGKYINNLLTSK
jgi:glucose-1-phosphate thymidylyltransferase